MNKRDINLRWKNSSGFCCNKKITIRGDDKFNCMPDTCPYFLDCIVVDDLDKNREEKIDGGDGEKT